MHAYTIHAVTSPPNPLYTSTIPMISPTAAPSVTSIVVEIVSPPSTPIKSTTPFSKTFASIVSQCLNTTSVTLQLGDNCSITPDGAVECFTAVASIVALCTELVVDYRILAAYPTTPLFATNSGFFRTKYAGPAGIDKFKSTPIHIPSISIIGPPIDVVASTAPRWTAALGMLLESTHAVSIVFGHVNFACAVFPHLALHEVVDITVKSTDRPLDPSPLYETMNRDTAQSLHVKTLRFHTSHILFSPALLPPSVRRVFHNDILDHLRSIDKDSNFTTKAAPFYAGSLPSARLAFSAHTAVNLRDANLVFAQTVLALNTYLKWLPTIQYPAAFSPIPGLHGIYPRTTTPFSISSVPPAYSAVAYEDASNGDATSDNMSVVEATSSVDMQPDTPVAAATPSSAPMQIDKDTLKSDVASLVKDAIKDALKKTPGDKGNIFMIGDHNKIVYEAQPGTIPIAVPAGPESSYFTTRNVLGAAATVAAPVINFALTHGYDLAKSYVVGSKLGNVCIHF